MKIQSDIDKHLNMADQPMDNDPQPNEIETEAQTEPDVNQNAINTKRRREKSRWSISKQDLRDMVQEAEETRSVSK